jgi:hypothetical protein
VNRRLRKKVNSNNLVSSEANREVDISEVKQSASNNTTSEDNNLKEGGGVKKNLVIVNRR